MAWFAFLPLFTVLIAAGATRLAHLSITRIAAPLFVLTLIWLTVDSSTRLAKEDWRGAIRYTLSQVQPGDAVALFPPESRFPYEYYANQQPDKARVAPVVFPRWNRLFETDGVYIFNLGTFRPEEHGLEAIDSQSKRLWIISDLSGPNSVTAHDSRVIREWLANRFEYVDERKFFLLDVMLWRSRHSPTGPPNSDARSIAVLGASGGRLLPDMVRQER